MASWELRRVANAAHVSLPAGAVLATHQQRHTRNAEHISWLTSLLLTRPPNAQHQITSPPHDAQSSRTTLSGPRPSLRPSGTDV